MAALSAKLEKKGRDNALDGAAELLEQLYAEYTRAKARLEILVTPINYPAGPNTQKVNWGAVPAD